MYGGIVKERADNRKAEARTPWQRIRGAVRWLQDTLLQIAIWGFTISNVWAIFTAVGLNYGHQDTWIFEAVWQPLLLALFFYVVTVYRDLDPGRTAMLTAFFVFTAFSVPALKYTHVYASTIDASVHISMMRSLAETGRFESNVYAYTPGIHLLAASLAQLSGTPVTFWVKIAPAFMGGMIPLAVYLLCNRLDMPRLLLRCSIILSGISTPMLYVPNGTTYAILVISPLLSVAIVQAISEPQIRRGFAAMTVLLGAAPIIWHAISSLLIPLGFALAGLVGLGFVWLWDHIAYRQSWLQRATLALAVVGAIGVVMTLSYWRFIATPIWHQFITNMRIFTDVIETQEPSSGILIPQRTFTLQTRDLAVTFLIVHARDAVLLGLVGLGGIFNLHALVRSRRTGAEQRYTQIIRLIIIVCALFCIIMVTTLVTGFAKHGYERYLLYVMAASAPIAGYGLGHASAFLHRRMPRLSPHAVVAPAVGLAFLIAMYQLFPDQTMMPRARIPGTDGTAPLFWQHQANTDYQRLGINFAFTQVDDDFNIFTDYRTYQQTGIFLGLDAKRHFHYGIWPSPRPAYVLYHMPGKAGAYSEQAEFRSIEAIQERRDLEGVNTVYDNGGTFLMFVPERHLKRMYLEYTEND